MGPRDLNEYFVSLYPICETKRNAERKDIVTKLIVSRDFNLQGQVDLMDFQSCPDGEFKWLLNYQNNSIKLQEFLRTPLQSGTALQYLRSLDRVLSRVRPARIYPLGNDRRLTEKVLSPTTYPYLKIIIKLNIYVLHTIFSTLSNLNSHKFLYARNLITRQVVMDKP